MMCEWHFFCRSIALYCVSLTVFTHKSALRFIFFLRSSYPSQSHGACPPNQHGTTSVMAITTAALTNSAPKNASPVTVATMAPSGPAPWGIFANLVSSVSSPETPSPADVTFVQRDRRQVFTQQNFELVESDVLSPHLLIYYCPALT